MTPRKPLTALIGLNLLFAGFNEAAAMTPRKLLVLIILAIVVLASMRPRR